MSDSAAFSKTGAFFVGMRLGHLQLLEWQSATATSEKWLAKDTQTGNIVSITIEIDRQQGFSHFNDKRQDNLYSGMQLGAWLLQNQIGVGITADIWQAQHAETGQVAALKIFNSVSEPAFTQFQNEYRIIAANQEIAGVVRVWDHQITEAWSDSEFSWFAMPVLRLSSHMSTLAVTPGELKQLLVQVIDTLNALQARHILYYEIKKDHLLLTEVGQLALIDFGTAIDTATWLEPHAQQQRVEQYCQQTKTELLKLLRECCDEADLEPLHHQTCGSLEELDVFQQRVIGVLA